MVESRFWLAEKEVASDVKTVMDLKKSPKIVKISRPLNGHNEEQRQSRKRVYSPSSHARPSYPSTASRSMWWSWILSEFSKVMIHLKFYCKET